MNYGFIGYYVELAFKGKQRGLQIVLAAILLLFSLLTIQGVFRFLSGGNVHPTDFWCTIILIYSLINFLYVILSKTEESQKAVGKNTEAVITEASKPPEIKNEILDLTPNRNYSQLMPQTAPPTRIRENVNKGSKSEEVKQEANSKPDETNSVETIGEPPENDWDEAVAAANYKALEEEKQRRYYERMIAENPPPPDDHDYSADDIADTPRELETNLSEDSEDQLDQQELSTFHETQTAIFHKTPNKPMSY